MSLAWRLQAQPEDPRPFGGSGPWKASYVLILLAVSHPHASRGLGASSPSQALSQPLGPCGHESASVKGLVGVQDFPF